VIEPLAILWGSIGHTRWTDVIEIYVPDRQYPVRITLKKHPSISRIERIGQDGQFIRIEMWPETEDE